MSLSLILQGLLPLVVFAVVDMFAGLRAGIIAAIIVAVLEGGWTYYQFGEIDSITLITTGLIIVLGVVSLRMNSSILFKFQPVVVDGISAVFLAYFQYFDEPLFVKFLPKMQRMLPPEQAAMFDDPLQIERLGQISATCIWVFLIHGALVAYAALKLSTAQWLIIRGVGIYVLLFLAVVWTVAF